MAGPLGADYHITEPAELDGRFSPPIADPSSPTGDMVAGPASREDAPAPETANGIRLSEANSVAWGRAEIPSASGYGNARSVAAVQSLLACGGAIGGVRLLSAAGCGRAREEQYRGIDQILGASFRYGMGYGIFDQSVGWAGWGGSMVLADLTRRMTVAYVMNQMLEPRGAGDYRALGIVMAAYDAAG